MGDKGMSKSGERRQPRPFGFICSLTRDYKPFTQTALQTASRPLESASTAISCNLALPFLRWRRAGALAVKKAGPQGEKRSSVDPPDEKEMTVSSHSFDFVCLGAGGGPVETDLSAYLLKPSESKWEDGIIAVEAGSGIGALSSILERFPDTFNDLMTIDDSLPTSVRAAQLYSYIQTFLISHSHLDHVLSLILSAGSLSAPPPLHQEPKLRRRIVGTKQVLDDLSTMVFSDRIWPNLVSWSADSSVPAFLYLYQPIGTPSLATNDTFLDADFTTLYHSLNDTVSALAIPVSHGLCQSSHVHAPAGTYSSTAFFIRHNITSKQLLFFGDVEPDSLARNPSTRKVWHVAASLITSITPNGQKVLDSIFIECSWPSSRKDSELYGHLNPQHLLQEMKSLAEEVMRRKESGNMASPGSPTSLEFVSSFKAPLNGSEHVAVSTDAPKKKRRRTILRRHTRDKTFSSNASDASTIASGSAVALNSTPEIPQTEGLPLRGALAGVKLYVMHFKAPMEYSPGIKNGKLSHLIANELRVLVNKEELGLEIIALEQGMRLGSLSAI
ncbi:related to 3`,5`-cyclic-nucleotide phosphodiesterase [Serendipita indica DSM 11827]|uniref:Related to 3`,5`-cyclic-nucleotide phosphodiesterase n=1 Tax=Serendipita indica (strain DSM 11827) TaxID=1109443 RepID=G4T8Y5_SERID|nr:related to 3`,5`-cyclic-nucleotide phosphodiesterase [Serendipita indica DSM 11827]